MLDEWGGWPTTYLLRHTSRLDEHTRRRYHQYLAARLPDLQFPSHADEKKNQVAADAIYASAIKWLKEKVRKTAPLVDKENAQYGFRRNMRGMRTMGLWGALIAIVASLVAIAAQIDVWPQAVADMKLFIAELRKAGNPAIWGALVIDILAVLAWTLVVNDEWVKGGAEQYAEALFATCERS
ncbi:hypothetical protein B2M20_02380 [Nitrobacter vulgaris]|uniref:Uncharacterized protein n=1 Tax=Nitrobacter vulgaris TaxID=29421 RepID=A0A1V4I3H9_NITVU|nr:hypothetical protein B2M20_02380 [Nitrobacter vulgaris]